MVIRFREVKKQHGDSANHIFSFWFYGDNQSTTTTKRILIATTQACSEIRHYFKFDNYKHEEKCNRKMEKIT